MENKIITRLDNKTSFMVTHDINISKMSPFEMDFMFSFVSDIRKEDEEFKQYELHIGELEKKLKRRLNKDRIKPIIDDLLYKKIWIKTQKKIAGYSIYTMLEYDFDKGVFSVCFNHQLKPLFIALDRFIMGDLKSLFALHSKYHKQLYILLSQWAQNGKYVTGVEEIMEKFGCRKSMEWKHFRKRVLDEAMSLFEKETDISFTWEVTQKSGKKITEIAFSIKKKYKELIIGETECYEDIETKKEKPIKKNKTAEEEIYYYYKKKIKASQSKQSSINNLSYWLREYNINDLTEAIDNYCNEVVGRELKYIKDCKNFFGVKSESKGFFRGYLKDSYEPKEEEEKYICIDLPVSGWR